MTAYLSTWEELLAVVTEHGHELPLIYVDYSPRRNITNLHYDLVFFC